MVRTRSPLFSDRIEFDQLGGKEQDDSAMDNGHVFVMAFTLHIAIMRLSLRDEMHLPVNTNWFSAFRKVQ